MLKELFSRKKYRWVQRLTGIRKVHHPRWSFGWVVPLSGRIHSQGLEMVYFEDYGWKQVAKDSYHDSTTSGVY